MRNKKEIDWKTPFVFWVHIEKREWFSRFWKSRSANCLDMQFFKWHISIGMPWLKNYTEQIHKDSIKKSNLANKQAPFSVLIGKIK